MTSTSKEKRQPIDHHPMEGNVKKYYLAMFFRNLWISMPVGIIYFQERGLSFLEMGLLEAIVSAIIFLTEIPSGAFADTFGRKFSTGLGMFLWGLSLILTGAFSTFNGYVITVVLMGFGDSFISGAINALFYDSLKEMNKEQDYIKYTGKREVITAVSLIIAAISGSVLYSINITLPFYAHGIALIIAGAIVFSMKEPFISAKSKTVGAQFNLIIKSLSFVWKNKIVRFLTIFWVLILTIPMLFVNLMEQLYLGEISIPVIYFGIIYAFTRGVIGFFAPLRYKIEKKFGERGSFYGITILFGVMFFLMVTITHPFSLIFLFFLFFTRDYTWTILDKYANDHIPSDQRATVLSIISFALNMVYMGMAVLVGYGLDHLTIFGLNALLSTMLLFGIALFGLVIPFLLLNYRKLDTDTNNSLKNL